MQRCHEFTYSTRNVLLLSHHYCKVILGRKSRFEFMAAKYLKLESFTFCASLLNHDRSQKNSLVINFRQTTKTAATVFTSTLRFLRGMIRSRTRSQPRQKHTAQATSLVSLGLVHCADSRTAAFLDRDSSTLDDKTIRRRTALCSSVHAVPGDVNERNVQAVPQCRIIKCMQRRATAASKKTIDANSSTRSSDCVWLIRIEGFCEHTQIFAHGTNGQNQTMPDEEDFNVAVRVRQNVMRATAPGGDQTIKPRSL
jgi:hypothetical protein